MWSWSLSVPGWDSPRRERDSAPVHPLPTQHPTTVLGRREGWGGGTGPIRIQEREDVDLAEPHILLNTQPYLVLQLTSVLEIQGNL